ncbi:hypothetical protein [Streptomyces sp. NPDC096324]|uniref:hypothetical protein n=1 Tax=Streptomyces sp. NPDC096324 TaxID=3366085 RepID=UPI0038168216
MAPTRPHRQAGRPPAPPAPHSQTPHTAPAPAPDGAARHTASAPAPESAVRHTAPASARESVVRHAMSAPEPDGMVPAPAPDGAARHTASAPAPESVVRHTAPAEASDGTAPAPAPDGAAQHTASAPAGESVVRPAVPAEVSDGVAQYAARLAVLLGDVRDPANPYGRAVLWAGGYDALPAPPAGLPGPGDLPGADRLARALGPLFRRDLALAHAWSIGPLAGAPVPHPAAALLGPAALLAATGAVLRGVTRIVEGLSRHEAAARQWRPVLATVFADLLACQSLTDAALRACPASGRGGEAAPYRCDARDGDGELLAAVVGYLVPQLAVELLGDLELVLDECGFDGHTVERRALARTLGDRALAGAGPAATGAAQARIVRRLNATGGPDRHETAPPPAPPHDATPGTPGDPGTAAAPGTAGPQSAAPPPPDAAAARPPAAATPPATGTATTTGTTTTTTGTATTGTACAGSPAAAPQPTAADITGTGMGAGALARMDADADALARIGRRLAAERRALRGAWAVTAGHGHDLADPAVRALADRQALLVLADRATAAREAAARAREPFLGGAGWVLLALGRITVRLGLALPAGMPDAQPGVWDELARRAARNADGDLYAARLPW